MTILGFPVLSRRPSGATFRLLGNTQVQSSPLDKTTQTLEMPGSRWEFTVTWNILGEDDWRTVGAFLARMRGRSGRCYFSPAIFAPRRGSATTPGTPIFYTAPVTGDAFQTEGWDASSGIGTKIGDWMSYADAAGRQHLHLAVENFSVNGSGICSHRFTPLIRSPPVLGSPLEIVSPVAVCMLDDDAAPSLEVSPPARGSCTITLLEALI